VFSKKESLSRVGCVKYGPECQVPKELQAGVYAKMLALEGRPLAGCTIHIVKKAAERSYNVTLHLDYKAANPRTQANLHVA
jgi:hypothetical protein